MRNNYFCSTTNPGHQISGIAKRIRFGLLALMLVAFSFSSHAQVSSYTFSSSAGVFSAISGGTVLGVAANDDTSFPNNPIGFSFCYNGTTYTSFGVQSNGFITMGAGTVNSSYTTIASNSNPNAIAALNFDIQGNAATGDLEYMTLGSSPNRTLVVQWSHYRAYNTANGDDYTFQIRLSENNGDINVVYGSMACGNLRTPQVGLQGQTNADFNNRSVANGINTWATSTAGGTAATTCEVNTTPLVPSSGQTYTWSEPAPTVAPTAITFTGVTASAMTLNWNDNSTNESGFIIQRSLDNITFTNVSLVASTSTATTGTPYTYNATGLFTNTLYYWRIIATNANCSNPFVAAQQSTLAGTMCGTYTIGPTGAYTSLTAAIAAVQANGVLCPLVFELQAAYVSTVETFPIVVPFLGSGPTTGITVRPELGATNLSITSAAAVTIDMSGASYFVFDGRAGGVGTTMDLTIANTSTAGIAARFLNDAQSSGYNYCKIRGVNTSTVSGVVFFGNAATATGNSNNSITNCELYDNGTTPDNLIYASNAVANTFNTNNNISNNLFHDWFLATSQNTAIDISTGNSAWTINNNSFYQTVTRTYTAGVTHYMVFITPGSGTLAGGFTVSGNYFGGTAPLCGGSALTENGAVAHRFIALNTTTGTGGANSIQGNVFTNFNFTTSSAITTANGNWCAINLLGTNAANNVGTITPNIIGSVTANNQIITSTSGNGGLTTAINSSATGAQNISNNQIGGITANSSSAVISTSIYGINNTSGTTVTISGNTIGSLTQLNNITNAANTSATAGQITGIFSSFATTGIITNNTVMNITNQYAGVNTLGQMRGIVTTSAINTVTGNTVRNLTNLAPEAGVTTSAAVIGISQQSASAGVQNVSLNTISGLISGAPTANVQVNGILFTSAAAPTGIVSRNQVNAIGAGTSGTPTLYGIQIYGGVSRVYNNFVILGIDGAGASLTNAYEYDGIVKNTATSVKFFYNSVNIAGTGVANAAQNTFAFRRLQTGVDSIMNNIFVNTRANAAAGGNHYSVMLNANTTVTSNANDFFGNGSTYQAAAIGATNYATLAAWSGATGFDLSSYSIDPLFQTSNNLHINNPSPSPLESRGITIGGIANDIDNDVRPGPVGSVNGGGTLPDIGADEFDGFPLTLDMGVSALWRPSVSGCHGASDSVTVVLKNYSAQTINFALNPVTINASVTGPNPMAFAPVTINSGTLAGNATMNVTVSTTYNMTAAGVYGFTASSSVSGDAVASNDAISTVNITISGGTAVSSLSRICIGANAVLTVSGYTNGGSIQWQDSPDNITFTNVPGATNPTLTVSPADTMFYRAVICGLHNSTSDTVNVIIVNPPATVGATRCGAGSVTMTASGTGTLNWFDAASAGNLVNSGTTYSPTVSATTTYYVEASSGTPPSIQTTTFAAGNGSAGNMFGITALNTITITSFDGHMPAGTATWEIWYRPNDYLLSLPGSTTSNAGWTLLGTAPNVVSAGTGFPTPIPVNFNVVIPAGQTYSFYVTTTGPTVNYTNGTAAGNVYAPGSNADFQFREGHGGGYFAVVNVPRIFNGRIHYSAGCASTRTPVTATVTAAPSITASVASLNICNGDSATLSVTSGNPTYAYTWTPATYLNSTSGTSVMSGPPTPGNFTYYVDAFDSGSGCAIRDTVSFAVHSIPSVVASVNTTPICSGTSVNLLAAHPVDSLQITNGNVLNTSTTYPAPYGNWYGGSRHQMLILASELTAAGLTAGDISGLSFQVTNTNASAPLMNFTIKMGMTNVSALTTTFQVLPMTQVYTTASYAPNVGINHHTFSTPFFWDGVSNIIVETCFINQTGPTTTSFTTNCTMRQTTTAFNSTTYYFADNDLNACSAATGTVITQRPNIKFYRSFGTWAYSWTPPASISNPNIANTTASPLVSTNFFVTVTDTTSGCNAMDSVMVTVNPSPNPQLGNDTAICSNTSLTLDASAGSYTYLWNDASTNQTLTVSAFGNYDVLVTNTVTGCTGRDTILVGINAAPSFSLGSDVVICAGNSVTFSGPSGQFDYNWSTLDTTQTLNTSTAGSYVLTVTDTVNLCYNSDTVALTVNALPVVSLGNDTAICSANAPLTLAATQGAYSYLWSDASTNDSLSVNATGTYYVTVTDVATSCYSGDTIVVTINSSPVVTLGNDTTFCSANGPITLNAPAGPYNYLWSDASTLMSLTTNTSGMYDVTVTDQVTGCAAMDTVNITVNPSPVVNLGPDTVMCGGNITLDAQNSGGIFLWNDLSTAQTLVASSTGNYYVSVTTGAGCSASDSIMVTINTVPTVTFTPQSTACLSDPAFALSGSPAGGTFSGPGVTGNMFTPSTAGVGAQSVTYSYTDVNGCSATASATITVNACVGINDPFIAAGMNVYPNPNNGTFTLTIKDADFTDLTIELTGVDGKVISMDKVSNVKGDYVNQLDLTTQANGIYFLKVSGNGQTYVQKIVKQD